MKKYNILFFTFLPMLILLSAKEVTAQTDIDLEKYKRKAIISKIEIIGAPSFVSVRENILHDQYGVTKIGYSGGIGIVHSFNRYFEIKGRLLFERKGFKQRTEAWIPPDAYNDPPSSNLTPELTIITGNLNNDYFTAILAPSLSFGKKSNISISIGPYISKLHRSQITITDVQNGEMKLKLYVDQTTTYKEIDYGMSSNVGYRLKIGNKIYLKPELSWNHGLVNIVNLQPGLLPMKNESVSFIIAFEYKIH